MKTRFKLLMLVLVLVLVALCIAACGGGEPAETTPGTTTATPATSAPVASSAATSATTPAESTGTAPETSQPPVSEPQPPVSEPPATGNIHPDAKNIKFQSTNATYTGKAIKKGYGVTGRGPKVMYELSFIQIDPTTGEPLPGAEAIDAPIEAGTYSASVHYYFVGTATDADKAYDLPADETKRFVVYPMELNAVSPGYGVNSYETFYYDGLSFDVAGDDLIYGKLTTGLTRNFALNKVDNADAENPVPMTTTVITEAGYYQVVVTYTEEEGKDNISNENEMVHTSIVYIRQLGDEYQVLKADGIVIDGVIDPAYLASASITSTVQEDYANDPSLIVNPYEFIGMRQIMKGNNVTSIPNTSITLYLLWGTEKEYPMKDGQPDTSAEKIDVPYIYVAAKVHDETLNPRAKEYTAHRNAWINDSIELSYSFGGHSVPKLPEVGDTYPTYSTVLADARPKQVADHGAFPNHTAVDAQKSMFFSGVQTATAHASSQDYVIEFKLPARGETYTGEPGYPEFERIDRGELTAGEFLFFCVQVNDLTYLPEGYDNDMPTGNKYADSDVKGTNPLGDWKEFESNLSPNMYCAGNRNAAYLRTEGAGPAVFQLSDKSYTVEIDGTDGVKDADYAKGATLEYSEDGVAETSVVRVGDNLYIYTSTTEATSVIYTVGGVQFAVAADGTVTGGDGLVTAVKAASGNAHEVTVNIAGMTASNVSVMVGSAEAVE